MPAIGIGLGVPFNRKRLGYPITGLQGKYIQLSEGGDLINTRGGISIPYVSGTGLDQLFDFSVLNDNRFDKGSYIGNAYGLPEYYNYPYVNIYYDATSATTRHYWKITDFHYANILAQSITLDNQFFLSAKATTNTSNVIASWSELFIYSTALADNNLAKMKTYIGIQDDFYGDNLISNAGGENTTDWVDSDSNGIADGFGSTGLNSINTGNGFIGNYQKIENSIDNITFYGNNFNIPIGTYKISLKYRASKSFTFANGWSIDFSLPINLLDASLVSGNLIMSSLSNYHRIINTSTVSGDFLEIDEINVKKFYQNYYKS